MGPFLECPPVKRHSLVVVLRSLIRKSHAGMAVETHRIERAQTQGTLEILDGALGLFAKAFKKSKPAPCPCGVGIERHCTFQQHPRRSEIAQDGMYCAEH